jgi:hypothetical protein
MIISQAIARIEGLRASFQETGQRSNWFCIPPSGMGVLVRILARWPFEGIQM